MEYYELYNELQGKYDELKDMHHNKKVTIERMVADKKKFQAEVMALVVTIEELADTWEASR
jgi:hypothetical protein